MNLKFSKPVLLFSFLFFAKSTMQGQAYTINTDRPGYGDGASTLPHQYFQLENGISFSKSGWVNDLMLRYGLVENTELRLIFDIGKVNNKQGLQPLTVSVKQKLLEQNGALPSIALVAYASYGKWASKSFASNEWNYALNLAFEHQLNDRFFIGYNIGSLNQFKTLDIDFSIGQNINEKLYYFIEYYGSFNRTRALHKVDLCLAWLLHPYLQFDISGGRSIFDEDTQAFGAVGVSYVINK